MPDGPGADPGRAFVTTALTSSMVKSAMLKGVCGVRICNWKGDSPRGIPLEESPCAAATLFSISSFAHDRVPPLGFPNRSAVNWKGLLKRLSSFGASPSASPMWSQLSEAGLAFSVSLC